ncbi:hypothetical protein DS66_03030 [Mesotoga sp. SC_3PWM13N19]|nr:hypothetical protein DS66_03030 [Mesotoga sp. SC_3PWM13N19]
MERGAERKNIVETFASLTRRQEAKIGTDGLLTSVPFFASSRPLFLSPLSSSRSSEGRVHAPGRRSKDGSLHALMKEELLLFSKMESVVDI